MMQFEDLLIEPNFQHIRNDTSPGNLGPPCGLPRSQPLFQYLCPALHSVASPFRLLKGAAQVSIPSKGRSRDPGKRCRTIWRVGILQTAPPDRRNATHLHIRIKSFPVRILKMVLLRRLVLISFNYSEVSFVEDALHHEPRHRLLVAAIHLRRLDKLGLELGKTFSLVLSSHMHNETIRHG